MSATEIDEAKLEAFMGQAVTDMGAIISAPLMVIGEKLGLYKAMAGAGPLTSAGAGRARRHRRALRARVAAQPGGRRLRHLRPGDSDTLHAAGRARARAGRRGQPRSTSSACSSSIASLYADEDQILEAFRTGEGMGWHEHDHRLFRGTERFFRPGYTANLVAEWIPALDGVQEKLERGAKVADVGCGHGASTILMAEAFPNSEFVGFDYHDGVDRAARARRPTRPASPTASRFEVASAKDYPGSDYDLVVRLRLPARHGRPGRRRARTCCETLDADGTWMIVEPFAERQGRGQPQPGRPRLLRRLDGDLHARVAGPGGRPGAGRPGRRGAR